MKLIKLFIFILFSAHICGCLWYFLGEITFRKGYEESWLIKAGLADHNEINWPERYISSVYLSVLTMITVGIAEINAPIQKFISIFIVLILAGIFAYSISIVGIVLQDMNKIDMDLK